MSTASALSRQSSLHSTAESVAPFSLVPSSASVAASLESLRVSVASRDSDAAAVSNTLAVPMDSGDVADKSVLGRTSISRGGSRSNIASQWRVDDSDAPAASVRFAVPDRKPVDEEEMVAQALEGTDVFDSDFMASPPPLPRRASTLIGGGLQLSTAPGTGSSTSHGLGASLPSPAFVKSQAPSASTPTATAPPVAAAATATTTPTGLVGGRARKLVPAGAAQTH